MRPRSCPRWYPITVCCVGPSEDHCLCRRSHPYPAPLVTAELSIHQKPKPKPQLQFFRKKMIKTDQQLRSWLTTVLVDITTSGLDDDIEITNLFFMSQVYFMTIAWPNGSLRHSPVPKKIEIWHYLNNREHINSSGFSTGIAVNASIQYNTKVT